MIRSTYTYAILPVSAAVYQEIRDKLTAAGYEDSIHNGDAYAEVIDMRGIALAEDRVLQVLQMDNGGTLRCGPSKAPFGWICTRALGHDGPCAATRTTAPLARQCYLALVVFENSAQNHRARFDRPRAE